MDNKTSNSPKPMDASHSASANNTASSDTPKPRSGLTLPLHDKTSVKKENGEKDTTLFSNFKFVPTTTKSSPTETETNKPNSNDSIFSGDDNEKDKLKNWKEAGKALRLALNKYATSPDDQNAYLQTLQNTVPIPGNGDSGQEGSKPQGLLTDSKSLWSAFKPESDRSSQDNKTALKKDSTSSITLNSRPAKCAKKSKTLQSQQESHLARSMQQSLSMATESDPMNQMWEDYQNSHVLASQSTVVSTCNVPITSYDFKCLEIKPNNDGAHPQNCDNPEDKNSDPPLSELRERMRKLVSNLPISKNRNGIAKDSDAVKSEQGIKNLSPKTQRRRHHKSNKETDSRESDDDHVQDSVQRSPPKHKSCNKASVDFNSQDIKEECRITAENDKGSDSMPELVSDSDSDRSQDSERGKQKQDPKATASKKVKKSGAAKKKGKASSTKTKTVAGNMTDSQTGSGRSDQELHKLKQTESMLNFADIESTESEIVSSNVEDNVPKHKHQVNGVAPAQAASGLNPSSQQNGATAADSDDSMPSLESASSDEEDNLHNVAASIIKEKYQAEANKAAEASPPDDDDMDLFDDLPDLVMSQSESDDDHDITLSHKEVAALQDINISDCSEEDAVDGDDEFECDCNLCQRHLENTHSDPSLRYMEDFTRGIGSMPSVDEDDTDGPDEMSLINPLGWMSPGTDRRDMLDLMFTNVIMHMLSVYPDLLDEQAPAPVSPAVIKSLKNIKISDKQKDEESSCSICLCQFGVGEEAKLLPCSHFFHPLCIEAWLQKAGTCPVCRHVLS